MEVSGTMDEQIRRGHLWKIAYTKTHAHEMDLFREYVDIVQDALERVYVSHLDYVQRQLSEEPDESMHEAIEMFHAGERCIHDVIPFPGSRL